MNTDHHMREVLFLLNDNAHFDGGFLNVACVASGGSLSDLGDRSGLHLLTKKGAPVPRSRPRRRPR